MLGLEQHKRNSGDQLAYAAAFTGALLDADRATPSVIAGPKARPRPSATTSIATMSQSVSSPLLRTSSRQPSGVNFFRAMARFHVRATPPTSPLLFEYGRDFPDFIERYEYARSMPWLADVARIERAWLDAYHAADAEPLDPELLAAVPAERLADTTLTPHPATRIVRSHFPAVTIFAANRNDDPVGRFEATEPEDALVTRPALEVMVQRLPVGGAALLTRLVAGESLGEAAAATLAESTDFDLPANIAGMLEAGAFTAIRHGD